MTQTTIPQADPGASYRVHKSEIDAAIARALDSGWYILGKEVEKFEQAFAAYCGSRYAIGVANGTDAIELPLRALGLAPGSLVATVSQTAVATVSAIERAGLKPVLVDIDSEDFTIDTGKLAATFSAYPIKAVVAVHLYGQPAALSALSGLCIRHNAFLIEDCAQAHGARFGDKRVGSVGMAGAFSLYPTKNLGAIGDGGVIVTSDENMAERLRALRQYGWRRRYISDFAGVNSRLDELQAAILSIKLPYLDAGNTRRVTIAGRYDDALAESKLIKSPLRRPDRKHVFHQYVVRTSRRNALAEHLKEAGIGSAIHYPEPIHRQPGYWGRTLISPPGLAITDRLAGEVLSLPMFPELTDEQVSRICKALQSFGR
jgi:dTDP-4-amino-4,6-dideoxygalactose transaminase